MIQIIFCFLTQRPPKTTLGFQLVVACSWTRTVVAGIESLVSRLNNRTVFGTAGRFEYHQR